MPTTTLYAVNYVGYFVGLAAIIVLCCCYESYGRRYPHNYILLSTFTVAEGFMLASACATYDLEIILTAAGMTAGITVALTLFAFQTKIDFTVIPRQGDGLPRPTYSVNYGTRGRRVADSRRRNGPTNAYTGPA
jgi:FtsH-binding integral membrane protein